MTRITRTQSLKSPFVLINMYYIGLLNLSLLDDWRFSMDTSSRFEDNAARRLSTCRSACQSSLLSFQAVEIISGWYSPAGVWRRRSSQLATIYPCLLFVSSYKLYYELDFRSWARLPQPPLRTITSSRNDERSSERRQSKTDSKQHPVDATFSERRSFLSAVPGCLCASFEACEGTGQISWLQIATSSNLSRQQLWLESNRTQLISRGLFR